MPAQEPPPTVEGAQRISSVIWAAMIVTQAIFVVVTFFAKPNSTRAADPTISYALLGVALMMVVVSYVVKGRLFAQAIAKRELMGIQSGLVVALALCETAGLLGMVSYFIFGFPYYVIFMVIAVLGMAGHFPRRAQFEAAAPAKPIL